MRKKLIALTILLLTLSACGNNAKTDKDTTYLDGTVANNSVAETVDNQTIAVDTTEHSEKTETVVVKNNHKTVTIVAEKTEEPVSIQQTQPANTTTVIHVNVDPVDSVESLATKIQVAINDRAIAQNNLEEAKAIYEQLETELDEVISQKNVSYSNLVDCQMALQQAEEELTLAEQEYLDAVMAYNAVLNEVEATDEYRALIDAIAKQTDEVHIADYNVTMAKEYLANAKDNYNNAVASYNILCNELNEVSENYNAQVKVVEEAEAKLQKIQETVSEKQLNTAKVNQLLEKAAEDLDKAYTAKETAYSNYITVSKSVSESSKTATAYYAEYLESVDRYNAAVEQVATGSVGFFIDHITDKDMLNEETMIIEDIFMTAMDICDQKNIDFKTEIGEEYDATSLENMKRALELIAVGNQYRTTDDNAPGLSALKVSDGLMFMSEIQANQEKDMYNHWIDNISAQKAAGDRSCGENSAWGYDDPYDGWYVWEKENYETDNGYQTGHYENIIRKGYSSTGLGVVGTTYVQNFTIGYYENNWGKVYSYEEYMEMFNEYYNRVMAEKEAATKAMNQAKEAYEYALAHESETTATSQEVQDAYDTYLAACDSVEKLESKIEEVWQQYDEAFNAETEAENVLIEAENELAYATSIADDYCRDKDTLETLVNEAEGIISQIAEEVTQQEEDVAELEKSALVATENLQNLEAELENYNQLSEEQKIQVQEAEAIVEATLNDYQDAQKEFTEVSNQLTEAEENYQNDRANEEQLAEKLQEAADAVQKNNEIVQKKNEIIADLEKQLEAILNSEDIIISKSVQGGNE